jgi:hypothetical protein
MGSISATLFCVGLPPGLSDFTHSTLEHRAVIPAQAHWRQLKPVAPSGYGFTTATESGSG